MELKREGKVLRRKADGSLNRTFMELKQMEKIMEIDDYDVLIEPLWNWNFDIFSDYQLGF